MSRTSTFSGKTIRASQLPNGSCCQLRKWFFGLIVERVGLDRGPRVRRRPQPHHVRADRHRVVEGVGGPVLERDLDRHGGYLARDSLREGNRRSVGRAAKAPWGPERRRDPRARRPPVTSSLSADGRRGLAPAREDRPDDLRSALSAWRDPSPGSASRTRMHLRRGRTELPRPAAPVFGAGSWCTSSCCRRRRSRRRTRRCRSRPCVRRTRARMPRDQQASSPVDDTRLTPCVRCRGSRQARPTATAGAGASSPGARGAPRRSPWPGRRGCCARGRGRRRTSRAACRRGP